MDRQDWLLLLVFLLLFGSLALVVRLHALVPVVCCCGH